MNDNTIKEAQVRNQYGIMYDSLPRDSYTLALFKKMSGLKSFMEVYEQGFVVYKALSKSSSPFNSLSCEQIRIALAFIRDEVTPDEFNPIFELPDLIETAMLENEQEEIKLTSLGFRAVDGRPPERERDLYIVELVNSLFQHQEKKEPMTKLYKRVALVLLANDIMANDRRETGIKRAEFILNSSDQIIAERDKDVSLLNSTEISKYVSLTGIVQTVYINARKAENK